MLFDAETGAVARQITEDRETFFWSVAFSPYGGRIAAGSQQGSIVVIDVSNGDVVRELPNRPGPTHCLLFTADCERLYAGNALFIHCFGMNEGATVYRYGLRHAITGLDVGADESRVLAEGTIDVRVVDTDLVGPEAVTQPARARFADFRSPLPRRRNPSHLERLGRHRPPLEVAGSALVSRSDLGFPL